MIKIQFAISTIQYWESAGFNTIDWRKSTDGTQAICHLEYAKTLIPNIEQDTNITIYICPSQELMDLLNSSAWTIAS